MPVKILDNSIEKYKLKTIIRGLLASADFSEISIATGYWDLPGMVEIFEELDTFLSRDNICFRHALAQVSRPVPCNYLFAKNQPIKAKKKNSIVCARAKKQETKKQALL